VLAFMTRFPFDRTTPQRAFLVHGTVVVSADYFKTFVAGLRNLFGGRLRTYETLMERARREALLRLKEQARQRGAKMIICVRFETTTISRGWAAAMEVLAYGTALIPEDGSTEHEPIPAPRSRLLVEGIGANRRTVKLENRPPAEGINATHESPLRELAWLLAGSLLVVISLVFFVSLAAQWIAPRVPYAYEARLAAALPTLASAPDSAKGSAVQAELQALADRLPRAWRCLQAWSCASAIGKSRSSMRSRRSAARRFSFAGCCNGCRARMPWRWSWRMKSRI
jgi:uncharacterized protein YbjQ (UPF0145 family)